MIASVRCSQQHVDPERADPPLEQPRGERVELELHQPVGEVHDGDVDAELAQPARGLEPEQPAADDDGGLRARRRAADRAHVGERAERVDVRAVEPGDRRQPRRGARGQHELVVGDRRAVGELELARAQVDRAAPRRRAGASTPRSANHSGPFSASRSSATLAGERLREQHAVVGRLRLAADERDLPRAGLGVREHRLGGGEPGHPGADARPAGGRRRARACDADRLDPHRAGLQLGLQRGRIDGARR